MGDRTVHAGGFGVSGACKLDIFDPEVGPVDLVRRGRSRTRDWQCDGVRVPDGASSEKGGSVWHCWRDR